MPTGQRSSTIGVPLSLAQVNRDVPVEENSESWLCNIFCLFTLTASK